MKYVLLLVIFTNTAISKEMDQKTILQSRILASEVKLLITDKIYNLQETEKELEVSFHNHAAFYFLKKNNLKYKEIKRYLEESKKDDETVKVVVDSASLEIEIIGTDLKD